jgi:hypothetical protein
MRLLQTIRGRVAGVGYREMSMKNFTRKDLLKVLAMIDEKEPGYQKMIDEMQEMGQLTKEELERVHVLREQIVQKKRERKERAAKKNQVPKLQGER